MINALEEVEFHSDSDGEMMMKETSEEESSEEISDDEEEEEDKIYAGFIIVKTTTMIQAIGMVASTCEIWNNIACNKIKRLKIIAVKAGHQRQFKWKTVGPWRRVKDIPGDIKNLLFEYLATSQRDFHSQGRFEKGEVEGREYMGSNWDILNYFDFLQFAMKKNIKKGEEMSTNGASRGIIKEMLDSSGVDWKDF